MWRGNASFERILVLGADRIEHALSRNGVVMPETVTIQRLESDSLTPNAAELLNAVRTAWPTAKANDRTAHREAMAPVRVVVSDRWLHWLTVPWSGQLLESRSANALYRAHFLAAFDEPDAGFEFSADDAAFGRPRSVAAIDKEYLDGIQVLAVERSATLQSVVPLSVTAWNALKPRMDEPDCAIGVVEKGALSLLTVRDRRIHSVTTRSWSGAWAVELERTWRRLQLREPALAGIKKLAVFNLSGMVSGTPELSAGMQLTDLPVVGQARSLALLTRQHHAAEVDFLTRPAPTRGWRRAVLAAGILLALGASTLAWREQGRVVALEQQLAQAPASRSSARPRSAAERNQQTLKVHAVNGAIRQLNVPIRGLLRSVQPPPELRAALLGLDVKSGEGSGKPNTLKISAEAMTGSDMTTYVAYLSANPQFERVYLTKHEIVELPDQPFRFSVEASWRE